MISVCSLYSNAQDNDSLHYGGSSDGSRYATLTQTACPTLASENIYFGGEADGSDYNSLIQSVCTPLASTNVYFGGEADGSEYSVLTQSICAPQPNTNVYFGGVADGSDYSSLVQSNCAPQPNTNVYFGGIGDGFSLNTFNTSAPCIIVPIELLTFSGECHNNTTLLEWVTATEINNHSFSIETSENSTDWTHVDNIPGAGNSFQLTSYSYEIKDKIISGPDGTVYYRLKQIDEDEEFSYSNIISMNCRTPISHEIKIYPNPNEGKFIISNLIADKVTEITVFNQLGELVLQTTSMNNNCPINLSNYAKGVYLVNIISEKGILTKKVIVH